MSTDFAPLFALSVSERLRLVEELWDSIACTPEAVPVPEWQKQELDRRKAEHERHPESAITWEEALRRLRSRNG
jgi:putative addiction module component (TIGR02574 family)